MQPRAWWVAALLGGVPAQDRLPPPTTAALEAAREAFLDVLARVAVGDAAAEPAPRALLRLAGDPALPAAVRFLVCDQIERCARASRSIPLALEAADVRSTTFVVDREAERLRCLRAFQAAATVANQVLAGAHLDEAERLLEDSEALCEEHLAAALASADADRPTGLRAHVTSRVAALRAARTAFAAMRAAPGDRGLSARYLALYRGRWPAALTDMAHDPGRPGRVAGAKLDARPDDDAIDHLALVRCAEAWISQSLGEADVVAQRSLQRRALELLMEVHGTTFPWLGSEPPAELLGAEGKRVLRLMDQVTDRFAKLGTPGVDTFRFESPADLGRLIVKAGEWEVADGLLLGRSTGAETRATVPFAWKNIDRVTIRGGIRTADGLNFRFTVGDVNVLLNWEVADENHLFFGEHDQVTKPRRLVPGREHLIEVRRLREWAVVLVDGERLAMMPCSLAGTVSVYPALGSQIFVRSIDVVGDVDLGVVVEGPISRAR